MGYICNRYEKEVNWLTIKEILVFEFDQNIDEDTFKKIDDTFWNNLKPAKKSPSLYFAEVLPFHDVGNKYIEIDTLALDICGEEWSRYNLLDDTTLEDLLCIELANKDYRHPYHDQYLDSYLQRRITKKLPFNIELDCKIEFPLPDFDYTEIIGYFMYKYKNYISTLYTSDAENKTKFDYLTKILGISNFQYMEDKVINLTKNDFDIEEIIKLCKPVHTTVYDIAPGFNFTNELFIQLLKLPNIRQLYTFDFSELITFEVPIVLEKLSWLGGVVQITIHDSVAQNSLKLENLIRNCIQLFEDVSENVSYNFHECILTDFSIFKNIGSSTITFDRIQIDHAELLKLASNLTKESSLVLNDCKDLHDINILEFMKESNITPTNLMIKGQSSCTFLVNFMIAEHLITQDEHNQLSIPSTEMPYIEQFHHFLEQKGVEFFIGDTMILMRNVWTKENIDTYNLLNEITEDEEPPFVYN